MKNSVAKCLLLVVLIPAIGLVAVVSSAQEHQKAAQTYFLVAQPDLPDPMFRESVILMLPPSGTPLVVGLIVNKPTKMKLSSLFTDTDAFKNRSDTAYFGGPVDISTPLVVSRTGHAPDGATALFKDIYLSIEPKGILTLFKTAPQSRDVRLYLGRAQWTDEQLHDEMLENSWYNLPSDPAFVFSADPASVWRTLVARAQAIETSARRKATASTPMLLPISWPAHPGFGGLDEPLPDR